MTKRNQGKLVKCLVCLVCCSAINAYAGNRHAGNYDHNKDYFEYYDERPAPRHEKRHKRHKVPQHEHRRHARPHGARQHRKHYDHHPRYEVHYPRHTHFVPGIGGLALIFKFGH